MTYCILKASKRAIVHECRLHRQIADGGSAKLVAVICIARDLFQTEVLIRFWTIKVVIRHLRSDLRYSDHVALEIAEHLVGLARNLMALETASLPKEEQRALLFIVGQCVPLAAREPVDRPIGKC